MKKQINIFLVILLIIFLSSCFTSRDDVINAKKEMGIINNDIKEKVDEKIKETKEPIEAVENLFEDNMKKFEEQEIKEELPLYEITFLDEQKIEIDDLEGKEITEKGLRITGKTLEHVDSITVKYHNNDSDFPDDTYVLKKFKSGDEIFSYGAYKKYETMDFGRNVYTFIAKVGDKEYKTQLVINIKNPEDQEKEMIQDNIETTIKDTTNHISTEMNTDAIKNLPEGDKFGNIIELGNGNITYSDIKGLEIKTISKNITCEGVTSYLADEINGWFFWNTCRPLSDNKGISFYVIRLVGDNEYIYEKHYYVNNGIYGVQELKRGTGVTKTNISEKNTELKETNDNYQIIEIVDNLFKTIIN